MSGSPQEIQAEMALLIGTALERVGTEINAIEDFLMLPWWKRLTLRQRRKQLHQLRQLAQELHQ